MTGKYVLPSALPNQETFHCRNFCSLSLLFHTQNRVPEHDPSLGGGLGMGAEAWKGRCSPMHLSALWLCTALGCSSQTMTLTQPGGQCSFISPKGGQPFTQTDLQLSSGFWQGFARAVSKARAPWQWDLASSGTLPNPQKILHGKNRV